MRLSFLTHVNSGTSPADSLSIAVDLFQAAEALGFDTGWVAQHRFDDADGSLPAPLAFLSAVATRTTRIRLGTGVIVLPTDDPVTVAEHALVADALSGGRLELGVGTGGHRGTFDAVGADLSNKRAEFARRLSTLRDVLRGNPVNNTPARLHPSAAPIADRIWQSTSSATGAERVASAGDGLLLARNVYFADATTDEHQEPVLDSYLQSLDSARRPRIAVSRTVYPSADRESAIADLRAGVDAYTAQMIDEGHYPAGLSEAEYWRRAHIHLGAPEDVVRSLLADRVVPRATELICQTAPGTVHPDKVITAFETTARLVIPSLRDALSATAARS